MLESDPVLAGGWPEPWAAAATAAAAAAVAASGVWCSTKVNHDSRGINDAADEGEDGEGETEDDGGEDGLEEAYTREGTD